MFRFTIRDVLWLTVVVGMAIGWWLLWRSIPIEAKVSGSVHVAGNPVPKGRVCLHSTDGQIIGARIIDGQFRIPNARVGKFQITIEGDGVAPRYSGDNSELSVKVSKGVNTLDFDLR